MATSQLPAVVGVLGGGRMGTGIAHAFACSGVNVRLAEANEGEAVAARSRVAEMVAGTADRGRLVEAAQDVLARVTTGVGPSLLSTADLVVEAVPEDMALKARMLAEIESVVRQGTVIATNTSALSIDTLAAGLAHPECFLGLHFFNPVPASRLVEIVVGKATSDEIVSSARAWVQALAKTPIVVTDSPGFASSRLGVALGLEAIRMLEEGVASAEDIDSAMTLGYKHPIGPLRLTDLVGLDVRLAIAEYLHARLGRRFEPPGLLRSKVANGELGEKTGRGFYDWPPPGFDA